MVRPPFAVLNELSIPRWTEKAEDRPVDRIIDDFIALLRATRAIRRDIALVSREQLGNVLVDESGITLASDLNGSGGRTREQWRYIQNLRNYAPFSSAPTLEMTVGSEEYLRQENLAQGLGLAASNRQLAVSMVPERWPDSRLVLDWCWLEESAQGELEERREVVELDFDSC